MITMVEKVPSQPFIITIFTNFTLLNLLINIVKSFLFFVVVVVFVSVIANTGRISSIASAIGKFDYTHIKSRCVSCSLCIFVYSTRS